VARPPPDLTRLIPCREMSYLNRPRNTDAHPLPASRLTLVVVLAALLLLSQGLGLLHRVEHLPSRALATVTTPTALTVAEGSVAAQSLHAGHGVFATHEAGGADCRLLDQLTHADALLVDALPLPAGLPGRVAAAHASAEAGRRHEARYLARAPPAA
jgi:hypothetical protein